MGSVTHLDVNESYISFRSARASSVRSLNLQVPPVDPLSGRKSFRGTLRMRSWSLKRHRSLASYVYNIVVLGSGGVGKTSIVQHYVKGSFPERHVQTLADVYEKNIHRVSEQDDSLYCLKIYDTAGTFCFPAMTRVTIKNGDGFFLMYSLDDKNSFDQVKRLHDEVMEIKRNSFVPLLLVANKIDVPDRNRQVTRQEGMKLAKEWGVNFAEISARNKDSTEEIFQILLEEFDTAMADAAQARNSRANFTNSNNNNTRVRKQLNDKRKSCSVM